MKVSLVAPRTPKPSSFTAVLAHHHHLPRLCLGRTVLQDLPTFFTPSVVSREYQGGKRPCVIVAVHLMPSTGQDSLFYQPKTKVSLRGRMWEAFGRGRVQSLLNPC